MERRSSTSSRFSSTALMHSATGEAFSNWSGSDAAVTGATGYIGGAALRLLSTRGGSRSVVGLARNAEVRRSRHRMGLRSGSSIVTSLEKAFQGATRLFFASDGAGADVVRQHANVIDAAAAAGVEHIGFTSIIDVDETSPFYFVRRVPRR